MIPAWDLDTSDNTSNKDFTAFVPDAVLAVLFSYLPTPDLFFLLGVCKRWHNVISTSAVCWRHVTMWRPMQLNRTLSAIARHWKGGQPIPVESVILNVRINGEAHSECLPDLRCHRPSESDISELCKWCHLTVMHVCVTAVCPVFVNQLFSRPSFLPQLVTLTLVAHNMDCRVNGVKSVDLTALRSLNYLHLRGQFALETLHLPVILHKLVLSYVSVTTLHLQGDNLDTLIANEGSAIESVPRLAKQIHLQHLDVHDYRSYTLCGSFTIDPFTNMHELRTVRLKSVLKSRQFLQHVHHMRELQSVDLRLGGGVGLSSTHRLTTSMIMCLQQLNRPCDVRLSLYGMGHSMSDDIMGALAQSAAGKHAQLMTGELNRELETRWQN